MIMKDFDSRIDIFNPVTDCRLSLILLAELKSHILIPLFEIRDLER